MKRSGILTLIIAIFIIFSFNGCKKNGKDGGDGKTDATYNEEFSKSMKHFKEVYKATYIDGVLNEDTIKNAGRFQTSFKDISDEFKSKPPGKYSDDEEWDIWIEEMVVASEKLSESVSANDLPSVMTGIREIQKLILDLDERNNDISAVDDIIQFDMLIDEMETAFENNDGDELKRTFMKMQRTLDRLFTSVTPDTAEYDESSYDDMKNELYDKLSDFEQAPSREERLVKLSDLKKNSHEFYYRFG